METCEKFLVKHQSFNKTENEIFPFINSEKYLMNVSMETFEFTFLRIRKFEKA